MPELGGKTAIITGGARGIGLAIAKLFHSQGANIVLCDIDHGRLPNSCRAVDAELQRVVGIAADVREDSDINAVVKRTLEAFGHIDILVNSAGVLRWGRLDTLPPTAWDEVMRINAFAPWRFMVAVVPEMKKAHSGAIINISSINGIRAFQGAGMYCTSKAALQMLSQVMALELAADGIRVNMILPGAVEGTEFVFAQVGENNAQQFFKGLRPLHPLGRNATVDDVAQAALFLASERSTYITGILLSVDGGRHLATNRPPAA